MVSLQNRRIRPDLSSSSNPVNILDLLFALLVHVCVVIAIMVLSWWHQQHRPEPMKRITVSMISAQQLDRMTHTRHSKPKPAAKPKVKPKPRPSTQPKAAPKPKVAPKPKPVIKTKAPTKPKPSHRKPKTKTPATTVDDFDPFAPVASSNNVKTRSAKKTRSPRQEVSDMIARQLSARETDRYIAMMQAAVQRHWKVPANLGADSPDPLVELKLTRDGHIRNIRILESSGNAALDASLVTAIRAAAPFQLPQMQYEAFASNRIRFHPLK